MTPSTTMQRIWRAGRMCLYRWLADSIWTEVATMPSTRRRFHKDANASAEQWSRRWYANPDRFQQSRGFLKEQASGNAHLHGVGLLAVGCSGSLWISSVTAISSIPVYLRVASIWRRSLEAYFKVRIVLWWNSSNSSFFSSSFTSTHSPPLFLHLNTPNVGSGGLIAATSIWVIHHRKARKPILFALVNNIISFTRLNGMLIN